MLKFCPLKYCFSGATIIKNRHHCKSEKRMDIKVTDKYGTQLTIDQTKTLNIWNNEMSHICATALE